MTRTYRELHDALPWRPIPGCPGRLVLPGASAASPGELLGGEPEIRSFRSPAARDEILVVLLEEGGLISYRREDGAFIHTLNTADGLRRKLAQLGIRDAGEGGET